MTDWSQAVCLHAEPDLFYPEKGDHLAAAQAKRLCGQCPIRQDCLDLALTTGEQWGVWGGLQAHERREVRRMAGMSGPPADRAPAERRDKCGSTAGNKLHQKAGEVPCDACRRAKAEYQRGWYSTGRAA